ncbi:lactonase family protein [Saccharicrinis sp. FJH54]|uniref:lactonase family protein n=1 Tax=Saccharicrinis sp. FJH54 TaxID=3344665 RepID=UPI0035D3FCD5
MYRVILLYISILFTGFFTLGCAQQNNQVTYLFIGSYTDGAPADGIYIYKFNPSTGELTESGRVSHVTNPSFLTLSPNGKYLYASNESQLDKHGAVSAYRIDSVHGKLTFINKQDAGGRNPVHVIVSADNKYVVNSNYTDPSVSFYSCNTDGSLQPAKAIYRYSGSSIVKGRQDESHIHSSIFTPDNKYIFSPDLGTDQIRVLKLKDGTLIKDPDHPDIKVSPGNGPRHFTFHPNGKFGYCVDELSGSVTVYAYEDGTLKKIESCKSYESNSGNYASADIHISQDGRFLYASNRTDENTISVFSINKKTGKLNRIQVYPVFGNHPRSFVLSPDGNYLITANQFSNNIVVLKRDPESGMLDKTDVELKIFHPSSLKMRTYSN